MKKLLVLLITVFGLFLNGCEDPTPPVADCEKYGYGEVIVVNKTGLNVWVDVTYTLGGENYEKLLYNNNSYTYKMDKGTVYIWVSVDGDTWKYQTAYLSSCESLTFTWTYDKKKSSNSNLYLEISRNGEVIKTVNEFETIE